MGTACGSTGARHKVVGLHTVLKQRSARSCTLRAGSQTQSETSTSGRGSEWIGEHVEYKDSLTDLAFIGMCRCACLLAIADCNLLPFVLLCTGWHLQEGTLPARCYACSKWELDEFDLVYQEGVWQAGRVAE